MFVTDDEEVSTRVTRLREHGMNVSASARHGAAATTIEQYLETGFNFRMTDIQAAVGLVQLAKLDEMISRRRALADRYGALLAGLDGVQLPRDPEWGTTNYQSYCLLLPGDAPLSRNDVMAKLHEEGISSRRGIMASHLEPAYAEHPHAPLPVTERLTADTVILPLFHQMTESDQDRVVEALRALLGS
jgi:perosamine synthetase